MKNQYHILEFIEAVCQENLSLMVQLLAKVDINEQNSEGYTALQHAIWLNKPDLVQWLLDNGACAHSPNHQGNTPLHIATWCSYRDYNATSKAIIPICRLLLNKKASVNVINGFGLTPLHHAIYYNFTDVVKLMLEQDADIDLQIPSIDQSHSKLDRKFWMQFEMAGFKPGINALDIAILKNNQVLEWAF